MAHEGTELSFDVRDNRTIFYTMQCRDAENARKELSDQIRRVHQEGYKPMNPILETIGIINLERSTDPIQNVVGKLMSMVEGINGDIQSLRSTVRHLEIGPFRNDTSSLPIVRLDATQLFPGFENRGILGGLSGLSRMTG